MESQRFDLGSRQGSTSKRDGRTGGAGKGKGKEAQRDREKGTEMTNGRSPFVSMSSALSMPFDELSSLVRNGSGSVPGIGGPSTGTQGRSSHRNTLTLDQRERDQVLTLTLLAATSF